MTAFCCRIIAERYPQLQEILEFVKSQDRKVLERDRVAQ